MLNNLSKKYCGITVIGIFFIFSTSFLPSLSAKVTNTARIIKTSQLDGQDAIDFRKKFFSNTDFENPINFEADHISINCSASKLPVCIISTDTGGIRESAAAKLKGENERIEFATIDSQLQIICDSNRNNLAYCNIIIKDPILR